MGRRRGAGARHRVRIIGGRWRGRWLQFPDRPGLRPSGDRLRETLFNWLQPHLAGSRCLDLFAGSGALGFEAASRGAASVVMVEPDPQVHAALAAARERLGADQVELHRRTAQAYLASPPAPFDLVFLDPPFAEDLLADCCARLARAAALRPGALVYAEAPRRRCAPAWPPAWRCLKHQELGDVQAWLLGVDAPPP